MRTLPSGEPRAGADSQPGAAPDSSDPMRNLLVTQRLFINAGKSVLAYSTCAASWVKQHRRLFINTCKYVIAFGLLAVVIWRNWGESMQVASRVVAGEPPGNASAADTPTFRGRVAGYVPEQSITVVRSASSGRPGSETELAINSRTQVTGDIQVGSEVAIWDVPPGVGYVWRKHVMRGEPIHAQFLVLAVLVLSGAVLLTFTRWYILVRAVGLPFRLADALRLGLIGFFFNIFLPGSIGGDVIKAAFLAREQSRRTVAVATVIMDRAIALWGLIWFVAILGGIFWVGGLLDGDGGAECQFIVKAASGIVAVTLTLWLALGLLPQHRAERFAGRLERVRRVGGSLAELWRAVWMYRCRQKSVAAAMLISFVGFVGFILTFYFCVRTLFDPTDSAQRIPTVAEHFLIVPIGLVIQAMPLFPGGAGISQLGFGALYRWLGCTPAAGILGSVMQMVIAWTLGLAGYLFYLRMKPALQPSKKADARFVPAEPEHDRAVAPQRKGEPWQPASP